MSFVPQLALVAGVMFLVCVSPGPDLLAVSSHALSARRSGLGVVAGVASSPLIWAALAAFFGSLFVTIPPLDAPLWMHGATLALVTLVSISWFSGMALLFSTGRVRRGYARVRRPLDALMGMVLVALGASLALAC